MKNFSAKQPEKVMDDLIPQQEINQSVENLLIEDKPVEPEIIEHVAKQSLEEHEEELANLLKEAQRDSPDQEIEQVVQREKDEGNFKSEKFSYLSVLIRVITQNVSKINQKNSRNYLARSVSQSEFRSLILIGCRWSRDALCRLETLG